MSRPRLELVPLVLHRHLELLHAWVTHPRSVYWEMQDASREDVRREYSALLADPHHEVLVGLADGRPQFLVEHYDAWRTALAELPEVRPGDVGMHLLVAPTDEPQHGFTRAVMRFVVQQLLADPGVRRVVVEPDVRNRAIAALNAAAGFVVLREVGLATKTAALSVVTREGFASSELESETTS